ncbi:RNA pseudouridylate synthase domain-containing protein 2 [Frankliniella fusca]|uniref:RNA pseudouridylate synthase domain-containing protein 2 n=1 Tax=Frankliniella fusca TaxID=407009 RepID=A0AAE1LTC9_9NEOP|nr:RNA pseudouridylate synthase domain-containing protein 2 [Frankliniella fusca]
MFLPPTTSATARRLRKVYPYYFTFTTFTKGRWVGEKILDVFAREFRAHPAEEYERCIKGGTLTVNYEKVDVDYKLKHNDLLANIVHRHEVPVTAEPISIVHMDGDVVVVNKPASIPVKMKNTARVKWVFVFNYVEDTFYFLGMAVLAGVRGPDAAGGLKR